MTDSGFNTASVEDDPMLAGIGGSVENDEWYQVTSAATEEENLKKQLEEQNAEQIEAQEKDQGFIANNPIQAVQEVASAVVGGGMDAVESVGSFLDLTGDTLYTGINHLYGDGDMDPANNPFSKEYEEGNWLDIPDQLVPENHSGMGKLTRGLVEFGLLSWATGGIGGATGATARTATRARGLYRGARAAGFGRSGARFVPFVYKGATIASEGAIADFITKSSEYGNIANLVEQHAPIIPFADLLAIDPDKDNPWVARTKTMAAGAGMNILGHFLVGYAKGAWRAGKAKVQGLSDEAANRIGNLSIRDEINNGVRRDAVNNKSLSAEEIANNEAMLDANADYLDNYMQKYLEKSDYEEYHRLLLGESDYIVDTRRRGAYYHGTAAEFNLDEDLFTEVGIYGSGFYTTEDLVTAKRLMKRSVNEGPNEFVYQSIQKTDDLEFFDLDKPLILDPKKTTINSLEEKVRFSLQRISADVQTPELIRENLGRAIDEAGSTATLGTIFDELRGFAVDYKIDQNAVDEHVFSVLRGDLEELGFSGYTRAENKLDLPKAKSPETLHRRARDNRLHQIRTYWNPAGDLDLQKADPDALSIQDYVDLAQKIGARAKDPFDMGTGMSAKQMDAANEPKPARATNSKNFNDSEQATYGPVGDQPIRDNLNDTVANVKTRGVAQSSSPLYTEAMFKRMMRDDKGVGEIIKEVSEEVVDQAFRHVDNINDIEEIRRAILMQTAEMYQVLKKGGKEAEAEMRKFFKEGPDSITYRHDGIEIITGTYQEKAALQIIINTLARQISDIAAAAKDMPKGTNVTTQADQIYDMMKVALIEHKKIGYMSGQELGLQNIDVFALPKDVRTRINKNLARIQETEGQFIDRVKELHKTDPVVADQLLEMYHLSEGKVRHYVHIKEYLKQVVSPTGGWIDGQRISPRVQQEMVSVYYNSILSSLKTPVRAVFGTNFIAMLRPYMAYLGAAWGGNKEELVIAMAQIDAMGKAWAEGLSMFALNWKQGVNRQRQSYIGRFDQAQDLKNFDRLAKYYDEFGSKSEQRAYGMLSGIANFNSSPIARYSQTTMGAGDAMARTIIGRLQMRMMAARRAIADGVDFQDVSKVAADTEEAFKSQVFKEGRDGEWLVSDEAARLAGDEAAMTKDLPENLRMFQNLNKIPGGYIFFPFVRTGYNSLRLTSAHTPLELFSERWNAVMKDGSPDVIAKFGIKPEELEYERAMMKGRMAAGTSIIGISSLLAMSGMMTGDYPMEKETRDLWRINGIQPNSFKFGNVYVSYRDLEPFNTLFSTTANVVVNSHILGEDLRDEWLEKLVWMTSATLVDKSMLAGVEDLAVLMNADSAGGQIPRIAGKVARSHLPYAGLLGQLGDIIQANEKEANNFLELLVKRDLLFKETVPPKYDILSKDRTGKRYFPPVGNPLLRMFNGVSPVAITWPENDPVKMTLNRMSYNLPEMVSTIDNEPLTSLEISELSRYMSMGDLRKNLERVMGSAKFKTELEAYMKLNLRQADGYKLYKQGFYRLIDREFRKAKKIAIQQLKHNNPELGARLDERLKKQLISKSGRYSQIQYLVNEFPK